MNEFEKLLLKIKTRPEFENPLFGPALKEIYEVYCKMEGKTISHEMMVDALVNRREELIQIFCGREKLKSEMPAVASFIECEKR